jgi:hypothetical protein
MLVLRKGSLQRRLMCVWVRDGRLVDLSLMRFGVSDASLDMFGLPVMVMMDSMME